MPGKRVNARLWGVDDISSPMVFAAGDLPSAVGDVDAAAGVIRSRGERGALQFGPYVTLTPGRYTIVWYGRVTSPGKMNVDVTTNRGRSVFKKRTVRHDRSAKERRLAELTFSIGEAKPRSEFRTHVDDQIGLELTRIEVRPVVR